MVLLGNVLWTYRSIEKLYKAAEGLSTNKCILLTMTFYQFLLPMTVLHECFAMNKF